MNGPQTWTILTLHNLQRLPKPILTTRRNLPRNLIVSAPNPVNMHDLFKSTISKQPRLIKFSNPDSLIAFIRKFFKPNRFNRLLAYLAGSLKTGKYHEKAYIALADELMRQCFKHNEYNLAHRVLDLVRERSKDDLSSFSTLINLYCVNNRINEAVQGIKCTLKQYFPKSAR